MKCQYYLTAADTKFYPKCSINNDKRTMTMKKESKETEETINILPAPGNSVIKLDSDIL